MDRPSKIPWPPLIYLSVIAVCFALGIYYPLPWLPTSISDGLLAAGVMMILAGFTLVILTIRTMRKHDTTVNPTARSTRLVTSGPFALSRNPIYLGNTIITFGLGVTFANPWFFFGSILAAIATNYLQVLPEEKHLAHHFGKQWRDYIKKVRRWI